LYYWYLFLTIPAIENPRRAVPGAGRAGRQARSPRSQRKAAYRGGRKASLLEIKRAKKTFPPSPASPPRLQGMSFFAAFFQKKSLVLLAGIMHEVRLAEAF
jgi:hypothetical protein